WIFRGGSCTDFLWLARSPGSYLLTSCWRRRQPITSLVLLATSRLIERLKPMYGPELSTLAVPAGDQLLFALATLISFESWDPLRHSYGLSTEATQAVWRSAIERMLPR